MVYQTSEQNKCIFLTLLKYVRLCQRWSTPFLSVRVISFVNIWIYIKSWPAIPYSDTMWASWQLKSPTIQLFVQYIVIPPTWRWEVYWFYSVRLSVRPSRILCPLCSAYSSYLYILSNNFIRCVVCKVWCKMAKFEFLANFLKKITLTLSCFDFRSNVNH